MSIVNISDHIYVSSKLNQIIEDTVNFFDGTPVYPIPITERFCGTGVYGLYCTAQSGIYSGFNLVNRTILRLLIYIGKAVPKGWRQGRGLLLNSRSYELNNRIREHSRSIDLAEGLEAKRIQTFPDNYRFIGCWTESMRQIGNAVPVELGYFLASSLSRALC
ncbi:Eco29kI family restriction endonuclease [Cylindrospermopsis raciborskii CHAB3438]|uniref:Eco29kI family restriction endonuclease n=1 Tax=Cylindrospermopsis raciborskii TaxID=77022 RepID=UPI001F11027A|nr:Eco29kI family restriction endonuclease [Cylindrospermopsis raciborskii]MCH4905019.1 Eco29kI family restriction endonuclease [Cylindrospermopsis raciborskii CHAB3438]